MTGLTSADVHVTGELLETYTATLHVELAGVEPGNDLIENATAICAARAQAWATMNGVEIELFPYERVQYEDRPDANAAGEICCITPVAQSVDVGVRWLVTVGKGDSQKPLTTYPEITTGIAWTWSARWEHWHGWFNSMIRRDEAETLSKRINAGVIDFAEMQAFIDGRETPDTGVVDISPDDEHPDLFADIRHAARHVPIASSAIFGPDASTPAELPDDAETDVDHFAGREQISMLGDEHKDQTRQFIDTDDVVWCWEPDFGTWMCSSRVDNDIWETQTPRSEYAPYVELRKEEHLVNTPSTEFGRREELPADGCAGQWRDSDGDVWMWSSTDGGYWATHPVTVPPDEEFWDIATPKRTYGPFLRVPEDEEL